MKSIKDFYSLLQIKKNASDEEIKKAYRRLALQYHPDQNQSDEAEEKFKAINEAYSVLSDPAVKKYYDRYGSVPHSSSRSTEPFDRQPWPGMGFGSNQGFGPRMGRRCGCGGKGFGPWGAVLRSHQINILWEGNDIICKISITNEESAQGTQRSYFLKDSTGLKKVYIKIPPGSKKGDRIIASEVAGGRAGKFILEIQ
jgi:DnaJ-class molecular chaperone